MAEKPFPAGASLMLFMFNRAGATSCRTVMIEEAEFTEDAVVLTVVAEDGLRERLTMESL